MFPVSFDQCAGWLHPASGGRGVVICGSFGFEDLCSHKTLAILAERIASAGQPALRFDYQGCGDSGGALTDAELLDAWKRNVRAAIDCLRARAGVSEIALVGLRLGAALAAEIAADLEGVARLVLIAPPAAGRSYMRELKALARVIAPEDACAPGELSIAGYQLPADLVKSLGCVEPALIRAAPAAKVLAMGRDALAGHPVVTRLTALGCDVTTEAFEGYDAMMCDPTASKTPLAAVERIAGWIVQGAPKEGARPVHPVPATITGPDFAESAVRFGKGRALAGVYCRSPNGTPKQALVILNAGAIHHIGWARGSVELARRLAASGVATLRIDVGGVGDSFAAATGASGSLYAPELKGDVSAALDWLTSQGIRDVSVLGACSGAYQALQATLADERIRRVALVNQLCYVWGATYSMQLSAWRATKASAVNAALESETENAQEAARVLNRLMPFAKKFAKGSLSALMSLSARASAATSANVVEDWFETLSARGVAVSMIFSDNDPGLVELERWLGPEGARATSLPGVARHILPDADHVLTQRTAREALGSLMFDMMGVEETAEVGEKASLAA